MLRVLGKLPLWLQTFTHEVPLPSSNYRSCSLSSPCCFFIAFILTRRCFIGWLACCPSLLCLVLRTVLKGQNLRAFLHPQKDPTYLYPTSRSQCLVGPYLFCVLGDCTDDIHTVCFLALVGARGNPGRSPEQQESEVTASIL